MSGQPAGVEHVLRVLQSILNPFCEWVRVTEHAPRDPFNVLVRLHSLTEIVTCGGWVEVERIRINRPHLERVLIVIAQNALRYRDIFTQQRFGFFEAP